MFGNENVCQFELTRSPNPNMVTPPTIAGMILPPLTNNRAAKPTQKGMLMRIGVKKTRIEFRSSMDSSNEKA